VSDFMRVRDGAGFDWAVDAMESVGAANVELSLYGRLVSLPCRAY
jgi:hypothetical protein